MDISISEQQKQRIKQKMESGVYQSPDEVIDKALELLDEHDDEVARELAEIHEKVRAGIEQLKNGQYTVYDEEGLEELKERIKRQGRERREAYRQEHGS